MNCCDANGQCTQGHGCPARAVPLVTDAELDEELRVTLAMICAKLEREEAERLRRARVMGQHVPTARELAWIAAVVVGIFVIISIPFFTR